MPVCSIAPERATGIIVEPSVTGAFAVTVRPILSRRDLERTFPRAWEALEYADLLSGEFGWRVADRTDLAA